MLASSIAGEILAPSAYRFERTLQITLMTAAVVLISMTFQLPSPALSTYLVFFVAKEDSGRSILISTVFIFAIVTVIGAVFLLIPISLDHPSLRILVIAAVSYSMFFLGRTSKLAPLANTLGLVMAYALDFEQRAPAGELATRGLLYVALLTIFPIVVVIVFNIAFGRHPERLLRQGLAARIEAVSAALLGSEGGLSRARALIAAGNVEAMTELKMIRIFRRVPTETSARLSALITLTYGQLLIATTSPDVGMGKKVDADMTERLDRMADAVRSFPAPVAALDEPGRETAVDGLADLRSLCASIEGVVTGGPLPAVGTATPPEPKSGFFKADAFSGPDGERFAVKATAAVVICYLTIDILNWPGIATCIVTCFIVSLSTVGESAQKMTLRLAGCTFGATLGYVAIVFILPQTTQIGGLLVLIAVVTVPAAWIAVGSERVAYIGFQIAFAAYLCILQGSEPKFDLTIARDRFIGIVFGNVVVCVIFTQFYATSLLPGLTRDLVAILERCRSVLKAATETKPVPVVADEIAAVYALVRKIDEALVAYGFETRATRYHRLHAQSCRLISDALQDVVADISELAIQPREGGHEERAFHLRCASIDGRIAGLATALTDHTPIPIGVEEGSTTSDAGEASSDAVRPPPFLRLHRHLEGLGAATSRYRRILHEEMGGAHG